MLMKFAEDSKLEGVTNNADRGFISMDLKRLGKKQCWKKKIIKSN